METVNKVIFKGFDIDHWTDGNANFFKVKCIATDQSLFAPVPPYESSIEQVFEWIHQGCPSSASFNLRPSDVKRFLNEPKESS